MAYIVKSVVLDVGHLWSLAMQSEGDDFWKISEAVGRQTLKFVLVQISGR